MGISTRFSVVMTIDLDTGHFGDKAGMVWPEREDIESQ